MNFLIVFLSLLNVFIFIFSRYVQFYPKTQPEAMDQVLIRYPRIGRDFDIIWREINESYDFFGIDNKKFDCLSENSEISCFSLRKSMESIQIWTKTNHNRYILCESIKENHENKLSAYVTCLAMAIASNRTLLIPNANIKPIIKKNNIIQNNFDIQKITIQQEKVGNTTLQELINGNIETIDSYSLVHVTDDIPIAGLYLSPIFSNSLYHMFGIHAFFYLSHALFKIDDTKNVNVQRIGLELYENTSNYSMSLIERKIESLMIDNEAQLVLIYENNSNTQHFFNKYENDLIFKSETRSFLIPSNFQEGMSFMFSNDIYIVSTSSLYMRIATMYSLTIPCFYNNNVEQVYHGSNSQSLLINLGIESVSISLKTNEHIMMRPDNEQYLRYFLKFITW